VGDAWADVGLTVAAVPAAAAVAAVAAPPVLLCRPALAAGPRSASGHCAIPLAGGVRLVEEQDCEKQRCAE
jgi:hypothetical protein